MEVFVSDERDPANVFLELLCSYILLNKRNEGKVIKINKNSKDLLKILKLNTKKVTENNMKIFFYQLLLTIVNI